MRIVEWHRSQDESIDDGEHRDGDADGEGA